MDKLFELMGQCVHVKVHEAKVSVYFQRVEEPFVIDANAAFISAMSEPYSTRLHRLCCDQNPVLYRRLDDSGGKGKLAF